MDINQIKDQATQKGLDLLSSIRQSLGLGNTPQPQPVSPQTQSYLNTLNPIKPAFTPIQTQIQTAGQIPSPAPSVIAPIQLPKTEVSQIPTLPQIQIPSNLNAFGVSVAKPDIKQQAYNYAIGKGFLDNIANVFGEIKGELTQPIYNNSLDVNKLYFDYLKSKNPKFDTGQYYSNLLNQAYKNSGLKGTLDTVNAFTNTAVLPVWNKVKIDLANQNGLNVSPNDAYQIITGKKELNLPDVLKLDPNTTDPIKYNAIRFLDFAPNFITLPGGEGTQTFAKEAKIPSEVGKFAPNIEKVFAQKLAEYETQIGRALTPEEVNGIRQAIKNPKDIISQFQKASGKIAPIEKLTQDEQDIVNLIKEAISSGETDAGKQIFENSGIKRFTFNDIAKQLEQEQKVISNQALIEGNPFKTGELTQYKNTINKAINVYNLNKRKGIDDIASITRKVPGFDEALQALEQNGIFVNSMEDLISKKNLYTEAEKATKKIENIIKKPAQQVVFQVAPETPGIINLEPSTGTLRPARYGRNAEIVANAVNQNIADVAERVSPSISLKNIDLGAKTEGTILSKTSQRLYNALQKEMEKNPKLSEEFAILNQQRQSQIGEALRQANGTVTPELLDALKQPKNYERFVGQQLVAIKNSADGLGSAVATQDFKAIQQTIGRSLTKEEIASIKSAKDITQASDIAEELRLTAKKMDKTVEKITQLQEQLKKQGEFETRWEEMQKYMADNNLNLNDPNQFADVYRKFFPASIGDWLNAVQYNSMLSSPTTFLNNLNIVSNLLQNTAKYTVQGALQQAKQRLLKNYKAEYDLGSGIRYAQGYLGQIGKIVKGPLKDYVAEVLGQMKNTKTLLDTPDQLELLRGGTIDTNKGIFQRIKNANQKLSESIQKMELPTNIQQEERNIRLAKAGTNLGKFEDFLKIPTNALEMADTVVGSIYKAGELKALAPNVPYRNTKAVARATRDLFRGDLTEKGAGALSNAIGGLGEIAMKAKNYKIGSNDPGAKAIRTMANFMLPFIRVPTNWLKIGFEYSPLGLVNLIGAEDKTVPLAKVITGLPISLFISQKYDMGELTAGMPSDKKTRDYWIQNKIQPWSVKVGNTWIDYTKFAPGFSVVAGTIASIKDGYKQKSITQTDAERLLSASMQIYEYFTQQSFIQNVGLLNNINTGSLTLDSLNKLGYNTVSRGVPYQGLLRWVARLQDGSIKDPQTFAQYLEQNIPWAKENAPTKTDVNGNPLKDEYNIYNSFPIFGRASNQKPGAMEGLKDIELQKFINKSKSDIQQKLDDISKQSLKGNPVDVNQTQIPSYIKGLNNDDPVNYYWYNPTANKLETVDLTFMKYQPQNETQQKAFVNKYNQTVQDVTYNPYIPNTDTQNLLNRLNVPQNQRINPSDSQKSDYFIAKAKQETQPKVTATPEQISQNVSFAQQKGQSKQEMPFLKLQARQQGVSGARGLRVPKPRIKNPKTVLRPKLKKGKLPKVKIKKQKPIKLA